MRETEVAFHQMSEDDPETQMGGWVKWNKGRWKTKSSILSKDLIVLNSSKIGLKTINKIFFFYKCLGESFSVVDSYNQK